MKKNTYFISDSVMGLLKTPVDAPNSASASTVMDAVNSVIPSQHASNTPFWAVDSDKWDFSAYRIVSQGAHVTFDVSKEATVQHLLAAIRQRGSRITIGFAFYDRRKEWDFEEDVIQMAQFGCDMYHSCVWFGEHVTSLAAGTELGIRMVESPLNYGRWELVSLPFTDVALAFRIGVDIVNKCDKQRIHYNDNRWTVLLHVMRRLLIPGYQTEKGAEYVKSDYDPDRPETWIHGVHCSQLVLLFLKRCILRNALYIPLQHRDKFLKTYSYTCLPIDLRVLLWKIWGGAGEFRDYRDVPSKVREVWYKHYFSRKDCQSL